MKEMPFSEVSIGAKLMFPNNNIVYTRVEKNGEFAFWDAREIPRTLTYEENGKVIDAYAMENSLTIVTVIEDE